MTRSKWNSPFGIYHSKHIYAALVHARSYRIKHAIFWFRIFGCLIFAYYTLYKSTMLHIRHNIPIRFSTYLLKLNSYSIITNGHKHVWLSGHLCSRLYKIKHYSDTPQGRFGRWLLILIIIHVLLLLFTTVTFWRVFFSSLDNYG